MSRKNRTLSRIASEAQLAANRANAKLSTGPRTPEGKAVSSQNGVKPYTLERLLFATVVPGECEGAFVSHVNSYIDDFLPQTPTELRAVESMAAEDWRISRFETALNDLLTKVITADTSGDSPNLKIATAVGSTCADREFININRAIAHCERQKSRQLAFLAKSRKLRADSHVKNCKAPGSASPLDNRPTPEIKFRLPKPINEILTANPAPQPIDSTPPVPISTPNSSPISRPEPLAA